MGIADCDRSTCPFYFNGTSGDAKRAARRHALDTGHIVFVTIEQTVSYRPEVEP
jgi:hypothetical protein